MKNILFFLLLFIASLFVTAQSNSKKTIDLTHGNIADKFNEIYSKSSNYKEYKVIKKYIFNQLKNQVLNSLAKEKAKYNKAKEEIFNLQKKLDELDYDLAQTKGFVTKLEAEKDNIYFFGIPVEKSQYQWIVWSLIGILIFALFYFIYLYLNSQKLTKIAKNKLQKLEEEYYSFKSNALEREQLLKRQLLDEQNKNQG